MPFIFGWLLNGFYVLLLAAVSPVLIFRRLTQGKYRRGWHEKLTGRLVRKDPNRPCLWFHAVSVGEVIQLQKVLEETERWYPHAELFITVTTETGFDVAEKKYPRHTVSYFPLDFTWAVDRALASIRPDLIVLVELELWPNFILTAHRRGIPLSLINGRMGEKSFRGYSRIRPLMSRLLGCFRSLACQSETYADRLKALGAPPDRVVVTGNIKFDRVDSDRRNTKTLELRSAFGLSNGEQVFIAGSTQAPEESYALDAWKQLRPEFPNLRLVMVPRHKERFDDVANLIQQKGFSLIRRSESIAKDASSPTHAQPEGAGDKNDLPPVLLLDTLGELSSCWGLADIAFVGGSLTNRGGQNMIEPAGFGAAVLFGPNTWNFRDVTQALLSLQAAKVVTCSDDLRQTIRDLLVHPNEMQRMGAAAKEFVASQQGATRRTVELIAIVMNADPVLRKAS